LLVQLERVRSAQQCLSGKTLRDDAAQGCTDHTERPEKLEPPTYL
jgi:hypothetical protein